MYIKRGNLWFAPGGHIELDEDPNQTVIREAKEESGFDIEIVGTIPNIQDGEKDIVPPRFINRHWFDVAHTHEHVDLVYFGRVVGGNLRPEEEGGIVRWFSREDLARLDAASIKPRIRAYALAALDELRD